jgi:hypothetical protein
MGNETSALTRPLKEPLVTGGALVTGLVILEVQYRSQTKSRVGRHHFQRGNSLPIIKLIIIIIIIIIIMDAIYALLLNSSKRGTLCQHERSRVTQNTQQTLNTYTDKYKHTRGSKAGRMLLWKQKGNQVVF